MQTLGAGTGSGSLGAMPLLTKPETQLGTEQQASTSAPKGCSRCRARLDDGVHGSEMESDKFCGVSEALEF